MCASRFSPCQKSSSQSYNLTSYILQFRNIVYLALAAICKTLIMNMYDFREWNVRRMIPANYVVIYSKNVLAGAELRSIIRLITQKLYVL